MILISDFKEHDKDRVFLEDWNINRYVPNGISRITEQWNIRIPNKEKKRVLRQYIYMSIPNRSY